MRSKGYRLRIALLPVALPCVSSSRSFFPYPRHNKRKTRIGKDTPFFSQQKQEQRLSFFISKNRRIPFLGSLVFALKEYRNTKSVFYLYNKKPETRNQKPETRNHKIV